MHLYFFEIALLNSPLEPLTYHHKDALEIGARVVLSLRNRTLSGVVVKTCLEPLFKTTSITELTNEHYTTLQIKTATFISQYYFCSLGEALNLFVPFQIRVDSEPLAHGNGKWEMGNGEESGIVLSSVQNAALMFLQEHPVSLLFGDTGSGKTEIYMKYFQEV